jgi:hypothetical protein
MRILLPDNLTKKTASEFVGRVIFSGSFLSLIAIQQISNYKCQVYFDPKKKLECNSVRQFNEYSVNCRQILVVMSGLLETDDADY